MNRLCPSRLPHATPRHRLGRLLLIGVGLALTALLLQTVSAPEVAHAATLPAGFTETAVVSGIPAPTAMAFTPDGRILVTEQRGNVLVIKDGRLLPAYFASVATNFSGERGLLGITVDPNFASNGYVYLYYVTASSPIHARLSRFTASGDVAVAGSERVLLELEPLGATNHNGGALHFGPDGKLYVAVGENAVPDNAQSLGTLKGKMLRLNPDGTIPADNPFVGQAGARGEIWALGLRNPYTFAFQPGSGRMFINDVGQNAWEEINEGRRAANYGWPATEGPTSDPRFVSPLYAYGHSGGVESGCAITGSAFYNPATVQFPSSYAGKYLFADWCSGWIRTYDPATDTTAAFITAIDEPIDLGVASDGSLYYLARGPHPGALYRVRYTGGQAPAITGHPQNVTAPVGGSATFSCAASGAAPLSYQWQRNGATIGGAAASSYTLNNVASSDSGSRFRCVVTNSAGSATSNEATLTVTTNRLPAATIITPAAGARYNGGQTISYSGSATDPEDGTLPASAFTWRVDFHHADHVHPFLPERSGATSGSFTIPSTGHTESNVWYRVVLTVRDSGGLTQTATRDLMPNTVTITLASNPSGLQVTLDGQPHTAPYSEQSVAGVQRSIGAPSPQALGGTSYSFRSWSDGGGQTHTITTPSVNTTYTATFQSGGPPPGGGLTFYGDALATGWANWSWGSAVNLANTNPVYGGTRSIAFTATQGWGGLYLRAGQAINTSGYTALTFAARATATGQRYGVELRDNSNIRFRPSVPLANYGGELVAGNWRLFTIPLADLGAVNALVTGMVVVDHSGGAQPAVYLDAIGLSGGAAPPAALTVYGDALAAGWANWSWSSTVNLAVTTPVYSGGRAISFSGVAAWAGLSLRAAAAVTTGPYTHLQFAARATQAGQRYGVALRDANGNPTRANLSLDGYGGQPVAGAWKVYQIPLADLNALNRTILGIVIQDATGAAQPALYVDAIELVNRSGATATDAPALEAEAAPTSELAPPLTAGPTDLARVLLGPLPAVVASVGRRDSELLSG